MKQVALRPKNDLSPSLTTIVGTQTGQRVQLGYRRPCGHNEPCIWRLMWSSKSGHRWLGSLHIAAKGWSFPSVQVSSQYFSRKALISSV